MGGASPREDGWQVSRGTQRPGSLGTRHRMPPTQPILAAAMFPLSTRQCPCSLTHSLRGNIAHSISHIPPTWLLGVTQLPSVKYFTVTVQQRPAPVCANHRQTSPTGAVPNTSLLSLSLSLCMKLKNRRPPALPSGDALNLDITATTNTGDRGPTTPCSKTA